MLRRKAGSKPPKAIPNPVHPAARVLGASAVTIARGLAAFFSLYTTLSLLALVLGRPHNQNTWWIDLSLLPAPVGLLLQLALAAALAAFVIRVPRSRLVRWTGTALCLLFCLVALLNMAAVYEAQAQGSVRLGSVLPFSFFVAVVFLWLAAAFLWGYRVWADRRRGRAPRADEGGDAGESANGHAGGDADRGTGELPAPRGWRMAKTALGIALTVVVAGVLFPLGQILCFGTTNYRHPVDAVVVFGAQVFPDGSPSLALKDRLDAAINLYDEGLTPVLIMSGGIDIGGVSEAQAMRDYAVERGVPKSALLIDEYGNSTLATAQNTSKLAQQQGFEQLGVTSTFYHMARIKMLYLVNGIDVLTMPAPLDEHDGSIPATTLREIPGWWYYWFTSILPTTT